MVKIISKKQFTKLNQLSSNKMYLDKSLKKKSLDVLVEADKYRWIHQATWMGEPILNLPQDMFAIQELIFKTKPEYILEIGQAWGGGLLFYSNLLNLNKGKKVIGVDIFIPDNLKKRLKKNKDLYKNIEFVEGDSLSKKTINSIKKIIKNSKKVMVILDSHHTHDHVLKELLLYSQFITKGNYLICCDTIIDLIPEQIHRKRPWGPGNNPMTASKEFLKLNKKFKKDLSIEKKLLFTCHPNGFLLHK